MRFLVVLMLLVSTAGFAQKKKKEKEKEPEKQPTQQQAPATQPTQPQQQVQAPDTVPSAGMILTEHFLRKYAAASRWNDSDIAKSALYDVIVENPGIDSLIYSL